MQRALKKIRKKYARRTQDRASLVHEIVDKIRVVLDEPEA